MARSFRTWRESETCVSYAKRGLTGWLASVSVAHGASQGMDEQNYLGPAEHVRIEKGYRHVSGRVFIIRWLEGVQ
jgi:hypothetical protein